MRGVSSHTPEEEEEEDCGEEAASVWQQRVLSVRSPPLSPPQLSTDWSVIEWT